LERELLGGHNEIVISKNAVLRNLAGVARDKAVLERRRSSLKSKGLGAFIPCAYS